MSVSAQTNGISHRNERG
jgi:hypothetical protein